MSLPPIPAMDTDLVVPASGSTSWFTAAQSLWAKVNNMGKNKVNTDPGRLVEVRIISKVELSRLTTIPPKTLFIIAETGKALYLNVDAADGLPSEPSPVTGLAPHQILNIGPNSGQNHFKVQVAPTGGTRFVEYTQADIAGGYEESPYFVRNAAGNAVQLYARMDAPTTSGTSYSRSELREMQQDGVTNMGFDALTGTHRLRGSSKITHQPPNKPDIVVAQLHNGDADRIAIRTQKYSTGELRLVCRVNGSVGNGSSNLLGEGPAVPYTLGREFEWMIELVNGEIRVYLQSAAHGGYPAVGSMTTPAFTKPSGTLSSTGSNSWYFKAGMYNQSNESIDVPTEYGQVELRRLQHWHTGWPTPQAIVG